MGSLHAPSILFAAAFIGLAGSILLARTSAFGARASAAAIPSSWLAAAVIQSIASFGHSLRGELPPPVVFSAVNAIQLLALGLLWLGARRMNGRPVPVWVAVLPSLIWLAACLVPGFMETQQVRLALYVPLAYGPALWAAFDLLGIYRRYRLRAALDMAAMVGLVALILLAVTMRSVVAPRLPDGTLALFTALPALLTGLYAATLPFLIVAIAREWERLEEGARRAAAQEAGRAEVERLHAGLPAIIFLREVEPDGRSRLVYRGGDVETVAGWPAGDLRSDDALSARRVNGDPLEEHLRAVIRDGTAREDWSLGQPDGSFRTMRTSSRLLRRLPTGAVEVVGYILDMTAERQAEARAIAAMRLAAIGEMGTGLAHEINQPLQVISFAAESAMRAVQDADAASASHELDTVLDQARRAADIIEHLRRFARGARPDAGCGPTSLSAAVESAIRFARIGLDDVGAELTVALGSRPLIVLGEATTLTQVVLVLLMNARDAVAGLAPGLRRRVTVSASSAGEGFVALRVADNGGGIPPGILPRLFEPFVTSKGPDGGIGLATSYGLVRAFGGEISGRNADDGAVFTVKLLAAPAEQGASGSPGAEAPSPTATA